MTKEQEDWLVAEVMDSMKMSETEERSARRYVKRAVDKILIYCNREDLPERLLSTAAQIAEDVLHYSFTINFRQAREQTNEFEPMGELEVAIRKGV